MLRIVANLTSTKNGCHFFSQVNDRINIVKTVVSLVYEGVTSSHDVLNIK